MAAHVTDCLQQTGILLDLGREGAECLEDIGPDILEHFKRVPERLHRVSAQADRHIALSDYHQVAKLQDCAEQHISKKIILTISSLLTTIIQNLSQIFESINIHPTFTNAMDAPAIATPFLILGICTSALSFAVAIYSTYKVAVLQKIIHSLGAAEAKLGPSDKLKKEIYQLSEDVLTLERNKAIRNIVLSVVSITVFILSNFLSMGIPLIIVMGCCILVAIVKIYMDIKAKNETQSLCRDFENKFTIVGYGSGLYDPEFRELMALVIPVIQRETGFPFEDHVMSYVELVQKHHVAECAAASEKSLAS